MPTYLASYDLEETIPDPHTEFLKQAAAKGWISWIWGPDDQWYRLPNTTLMGSFGSLTAAQTAFDDSKIATANAVGKHVNVEKFIIVDYGVKVFDSDLKQKK